MIAAIRRYARALLLTLRFTLRGEQPLLLRVRERNPKVADWWDQTIRLVEALEKVAAANRVDPAALIVRADKHDMSMATILAAVKYHAEREYPYLLAHNDQYAGLTIQATNLNDRYLVTLLGRRVDERLNAAVEALSAHLAALPTDS